MIKSFRCKETERLFHREVARRLPSEIIESARMKLEMLDAAEVIEDLRIPPSNHLEKLSGNRAGQYSIRINRQWRVCFRWQSGNAFDVDVADYH
ncbi:MAG TPA: type II toxin-antitoxin system RelE/ParE family toxin [Candidatus Ozemobacteraceae bacterium]|nr:type II toxin-antitoxin system RelE/ParE family toxin [Candidatus Ozemobacteraceae bacterium]